MQHFKLLLVSILTSLSLHAFAGNPVSLTVPTVDTAMTSGTTYGPYTYTLTNNVGVPVNLSPSEPISITGNNTAIVSITDNCPSNAQGIYVPVSGCSFDINIAPTVAGTINDTVVVDFTGGSLQPAISSVIPTIIVAARPKFLAVGYELVQGQTQITPYVFESTDKGATWVLQNISPTIANVQLTAAGGANGKLVFCGAPTAGSTQYFSTATGWALVSSPPSLIASTIEDYAYGNGLFIAVTPTTVWYSSDGSTWSATTISVVNGGYTPSAAFGTGYYTAIFKPSTTGPTTIYYNNPTTADSGSRTISNSSSLIIRDIAYGNSIWVVVGTQTGKPVIYTANTPGGTWTASDDTQFSDSTDFNTVAYGNNQFVALSAAGKVYTSPNGTTWTAGSTLTSFVPAPHGLMYDATTSTFVAVGANSKIYTSTNGNSWTASTAISPSGITFTGVASDSSVT